MAGTKLVDLSSRGTKAVSPIDTIETDEHTAVKEQLKSIKYLLYDIANERRREQDLTHLKLESVEMVKQLIAILSTVFNLETDDDDCKISHEKLISAVIEFFEDDKFGFELKALKSDGVEAFNDDQVGLDIVELLEERYSVATAEFESKHLLVIIVGSC